MLESSLTWIWTASTFKVPILLYTLSCSHSMKYELFGESPFKFYSTHECDLSNLPLTLNSYAGWTSKLPIQFFQAPRQLTSEPNL